MSAAESDAKTNDSRPDTATAKPPFQFTLLRLFLWVTMAAVVCSLLAWAMTAVRSANEAAAAPRCASRLQSIVNELKRSASFRGHFPAAGTIGTTGELACSWRLDVLANVVPDTVRKSGYRFDEPWNSPHNGRWTINRNPRMFCCPKDDRSSPTYTSYVAVVGPDTMWPGAKPGPPTQTVDLDTLLIVELPDSDIVWAEPRDVTVGELWKVIQREAMKRRPHHPDGLHYATVGGEVRTLPYDITEAELRELVRAKPRQPEVE